MKGRYFVSVFLISIALLVAELGSMRFMSVISYSVAVVIASLLMFSGIGSAFSSRYLKSPHRGITIGVGGILVFLFLHMIFFGSLANSLLGMSEAIRIGIAVLSLAPLGFFMGFPFPLGLHVLAQKGEIFLPWALAINGSVSVFATVLTSILSIHLGFFAIFLFAGGLYVLAYVSFSRYTRQAGVN